MIIPGLDSRLIQKTYFRLFQNGCDREIVVHMCHCSWQIVLEHEHAGQLGFYDTHTEFVDIKILIKC